VKVARDSLATCNYLLATCNTAERVTFMRHFTAAALVRLCPKKDFPGIPARTALIESCLSNVPRNTMPRCQWRMLLTTGNLQLADWQPITSNMQPATGNDRRQLDSWRYQKALPNRRNSAIPPVQTYLTVWCVRLWHNNFIWTAFRPELPQNGHGQRVRQLSIIY